jgi:hypothetical protein
MSQTAVHIINGADDIHDAAQMAALCPNATPVFVQGDHISTVGDPFFRDALVAYVRTGPGE